MPHVIRRLITAGRLVFVGLALAWGGIVNVFLIGNLIKPSFPTIAILNQLAPWVTLGSFFVFAVAFTLRAPLKLVLWVMPGALAFIQWFAPAWLPKPAPDVEGITITAATQNMLGSRANMDEIERLIRAMDADIMALQEVRRGQPDRFARDLADLYPYHAAHVVREDGVLLLSRYPIAASDTRVVDGRDGRHLRVELEIEGQRVAVYVIHPPTPAWVPGVDHLYEMLFVYDESRVQPPIEFVIERIQAETLPVLVLCDCNSTPRSRQYRALDAVLDEAFGARGWGMGFTHPANSTPALRIDYVWYDDHFEALEAKVWPEAGTSDHYPVWAKLVLKQR
jgi:endonuclease/exonuclease/phosphatase family metal-dependent hydrolase